MDKLWTVRNSCYPCTVNHQKGCTKCVSFCIQADDVKVKINKSSYFVRSTIQVLVQLCVFKLPGSKGCFSPSGDLKT